MTKRAIRPRRPTAAPKSSRVPMPNPRLGAQTRKILTKHYRAKHGVR